MWALKHLVLSADNDVKKVCLEELGEGWLIQIISAESEDDIGTCMRAGLKDEVESGADEMDIGDSLVSQVAQDDEDARMLDHITSIDESKNEGSSRLAISSSDVQPGQAAATNSRLAILRDLEMDSCQRQRKDDVEVQEQGLEFIRNLIGHVNSVGTSETSEMIDHLFNALGRDRIFAILADKLRPKVSHTLCSRESGNGSRITPPHAEIVAAVGYILVHMAASIPRHRQQVIAQTELLGLVVQQFSHHSKEVRVALCWLVINLTWMDDTPDGSACAQRAQKLKELGFLTKLEALLNDVELDVRERAKTAVFQMKQHGC